MGFGDLNYLAVVIATVAAFIFGAVYYGVLGKPWMKAAKIDPAEAKMSVSIMATGFICQFVMAVLLAGLIGHLGAGDPTVRTSIVTGFFVWLGFMVTTMIVNQRFQGFGWMLSLIDGVHWLGVALIMGAIIGWMGVY